ncbi:MAG: hypothetical protein MK179_15135 [Pirellulaceae bacterium]|nr:hypothetical protein [Pirellulaceae bacterium]
MSLFENDEYRWRETYFVMMTPDSRPMAEDVRAALKQVNRRYELGDPRTNETGQLESLTLFSPDDNAAMDITYIEGDEVVEQINEMIDDMKRSATTDEERQLVRQLPGCTARLDVYHFEKLSFIGSDDEEEEFLDPGALLIVLEHLADLCRGIAVDPQSGSVVT